MHALIHSFANSSLLLTGLQILKTICQDQRKQSESQPLARGVGSVASSIDNLLDPKSLEELEKLEKDVEKLRKRKQRVMYWMGKIFSDSKWGSGPRREFR